MQVAGAIVASGDRVVVDCVLVDAAEDSVDAAGRIQLRIEHIGLRLLSNELELGEVLVVDRLRLVARCGDDAVAVTICIVREVGGVRVGAAGDNQLAARRDGRSRVKVECRGVDTAEHIASAGAVIHISRSDVVGGGRVGAALDDIHAVGEHLRCRIVVERAAGDGAPRLGEGAGARHVLLRRYRQEVVGPAVGAANKRVGASCGILCCGQRIVGHRLRVGAARRRIEPAATGRGARPRAGAEVVETGRLIEVGAADVGAAALAARAIVDVEFG